MNYRDSNYTIYVKELTIVVDCFTVEQVMNNLNLYSLYDRRIYKMNHKTRKAELIKILKAERGDI